MKRYVLIVPVKITNNLPCPGVVFPDFLLLFQRIRMKKIPDIEGEKVAGQGDWRFGFNGINRVEIRIADI